MCLCLPSSTADYPSVNVQICSSVAGISRPLAAGLRQFDTSHLLSRLQSVMNAAARLIFSLSTFQHITPLLRQLHRLRLQTGLHSNKQYSCTLYKCLRGSAPAYLTEVLRCLSGGRCRGSSATPFQFLLIIDFQPHRTSYCW